jgi:hypothetical protein
VPKDPPAPIQELPPDQKPAGQNIQWIPGYWGWDQTRTDFLWVSGIWREPPPNSQWVPGYWNDVEGGHQWVPGTWVPVSTAQGQGQPSPQAQPQYMPRPPASLEAGPNTPQPSANVSWTPGYWSWQQNNYVWRPGFWAAIQPNWIWVPAHYVFTPSGFLFIPGYWDVPIASRGLMFAPVYYPQPVYAQPGFVFAPSITIAGPAITANLFVQASTNQYFFGDFYAQNFVSVGITPWFSFTFATGRPAYYDPLFSFYAVVNLRQNPNWIVEVRQQYALRRDHIDLRPPRTYREQLLVERNVNITRNINITRNVVVEDHRSMAMPLSRIAAEGHMRMVRVEAAERRQWQQKATELHQFREQRIQHERAGARERAENRALAAHPRPMALPHSPVGAHHAPNQAGSHAAVAHRPEHEGQAGNHPGAAGAHRPEYQRQAGQHPGGEAMRRPAGAAEAQRRMPGGANANEAARNAANRARPGAEGNRAEPRGEPARRPGGRQPRRPAEQEREEPRRREP